MTARLDRWHGICLRSCVQKGRWILRSNLAGRTAVLLQRGAGYMVDDVIDLGRQGFGTLETCDGFHQNFELWLLRVGQFERRHALGVED